MEKKEFQKAIQEARKISPKRKFKQTFELMVNLKGLNMKNPDNHVDQFVVLPHPHGKPVKLAALVGVELKDTATENCDTVVLSDNFDKYAASKKDIKKLAEQHTYFIAQAPMMGQVAKVFGRVFGPRGKMPNPKSGCVVPPNANLKPIAAKLKKTLHVKAKLHPAVQVKVATEEMDDAQVLDNIMAVYNAVVHALPQEENNVKSVILKLTMGPGVKIGAKEKKEAAPATEAPKEQAPAKPEAEVAQ